MPERCCIGKQAGMMAMLVWLTLIAFAGQSAWAAPDSRLIAKALTKSAGKGASPQTLWNVGFHFFNHYGPTRDMALAISQGYAAAQAKNQEQSRLFQKAARFWENEHKYWMKNKPGDRNNRIKDPVYFGFPADWESNLRNFRAGNQKYRNKYNFIHNHHRRLESDLRMFRSRGR